MKVCRSDTLAGHPLIKIRDLLRPYRQGAITAKDVETELGLSGSEADEVLQAMVDAGLIEPENEQRGFWLGKRGNSSKNFAKSGRSLSTASRR